MSDADQATLSVGAADLPTGTITFLFTDIEGSTRLLRDLGDRYAELLETHREILRACFRRWHGHEVDTQGDAFFVAFQDPVDAIGCGLDGQRRLAAQDWPGGVSVRVRMSIHTGDAALTRSGYVGLEVVRAARIMAVGRGGQVLLSEATVAVVGDRLVDGASLVDLGEHRLKDLDRPERLFGLEHPTLPRVDPSVRRRADLPSETTTFIGREADLAQIGALLADNGVRLLSLVGPGGVGKTRLALRAASDQADRVEDGTIFVDLSPVREPNAALERIATAIGAQQAPGEPILTSLNIELRERSPLLVLDNLEQVTPVANSLVQLLEASPGTKMLVTSRQALNVRAERRFMVEPLSLPHVTMAATTPGEAGGSEAVALFVERARAVRPDFRLTDRNTGGVVDVCRRLDGLPLAIELAAARLSLFSVDGLRAGLDAGWAVLAEGQRDMPERQRTLGATIAWSFDLLDPDERALLESLSCFRGAGYAAVEAVAAGLGSTGDRDTLSVLGSLLDKSLARRTDGMGGTDRVAVLETVRAFAAERLDEDLARSMAVHRAHATYYAGLAGDGSGLLGPDGPGLMVELELEHDNLRAAIDWAVANGEAEIAMRLGWALWRFWQRRGHLNEASERLAAILSTPGSDGVPPEVRSRAYRAAGSIAYWRADWEVAVGAYATGVELARSSGDRRAVADALYDHAFAPAVGLMTVDERAAAGEPSLREALALYQELGDRHGQAGCHWFLATAELTRGKHAEAAIDLEACLRLYRETSDDFGTGWAHHMLGVLEAEQGRLDIAEGHFRAALAIFSAADDSSAYPILVSDFARLHRLRGEDQQAWRLFGVAKGFQERTGAELNFDNIAFHFPERPIGDPVADAAWEAGMRLSPADAIAELLGR